MPNKEEKQRLVDLTDLTTKQIEKWFSNKIARSSKKKPTKNLSFEKKKILYDYYDLNDYPNKEELARIAIKLEMDEQKVNDWFIKRRYYDKKRFSV